MCGKAIIPFIQSSAEARRDAVELGVEAASHDASKLTLAQLVIFANAVLNDDEDAFFALQPEYAELTKTSTTTKPEAASKLADFLDEHLDDSKHENVYLYYEDAEALRALLADYRRARAA